jgi:hypothetical protein
MDALLQNLPVSSTNATSRLPKAESTARRVGRPNRASALSVSGSRAVPRRKSVRTIREGFNYQDHLGAIKLLDALRDERTALVTLESSDGSHVDDVVVETATEINYFQVKWATESGAFYSFDSLRHRRSPRSASLLTKFAKSWRRLRGGNKLVLLHLFSNRLPHTDADDLASALLPSGSLRPDFLSADRYAAACEAWRDHVRLGAADFEAFVHALRFELAQPNELAIRDQVLLRLDALGIGRDHLER